jgi:hypothetical protein
LRRFTSEPEKWAARIRAARQRGLTTLPPRR